MGHFSVIERVGKKHIYLVDPEDGKTIKIIMRWFSAIFYVKRIPKGMVTKVINGNGNAIVNNSEGTKIEPL